MESITLQKKKIDTHALSGWFVHSIFAYQDDPDSLTMNRDKNCLEEFVEHISVLKSLITPKIER